MVFASTQEDIFVDEEKFCDTLVLYMPLFSLPELHDCATKVAVFKTLQRPDIDEGFAVAGGIARVVLQGQVQSRGLRLAWIDDVIGALKGHQNIQVR